MKLIYIVTRYETGDGTSAAVRSQIQVDESVYDKYLVVAKIIKTSEKELNIVSYKEVDVIKDFMANDKVLLHYFKATNSNILMDILELVGYDKPIVTTICQSPSYYNLWLTPFELKHTWHFVFIDKTSYNNKLISFIPKERKSQIYLSGSKMHTIKSFENNIPNNGMIVYGRGSSSIKCPKTMFEVFDRIDIPNKLFRIVGIEGDSWIKEAAKKRNNVEVYGKLSPEKWKEMCNSFDVFLYQLPDDCFASLDGTLGLAMLLEKPVVYMGSEAPKERFHNNENGYVANSIDEMASYATRLGKNAELRKDIGRKGRISTLNDFKFEDRMQKYNDVYYFVLNNNIRHFKIPFSYWIRFFKDNKKQSREYIKGVLRINFKILYYIYTRLTKKYN